jgi:hypothetical protein
VARKEIPLEPNEKEKKSAILYYVSKLTKNLKSLVYFFVSVYNQSIRSAPKHSDTMAAEVFQTPIRGLSPSRFL